MYVNIVLISDLIRSMTDSSLVFLLGFGIQLLFLTNLGISMTSFMSDSSVDRSSLVFFFRIEEYFHSMHVRGHIDDKTMEYLNPEDPKPGRYF